MSSFAVSSSGLPVATKDPQSKLDYGFDWITDGWLPLGDHITSASWSQSHAAGVEDLVLSQGTFGDGLALIWIEGGDVGKDYRLTCEINTQAGRRDDRTFILKIRER